MDSGVVKVAMKQGMLGFASELGTGSAKVLRVAVRLHLRVEGALLFDGELSLELQHHVSHLGMEHVDLVVVGVRLGVRLEFGLGSGGGG